jgi:hypothetical protein
VPITEGAQEYVLSQVVNTVAVSNETKAPDRNFRFVPVVKLNKYAVQIFRLGGPLKKEH